ncbi:MAG: Protein HemY [Legionellaceae bacterium]
MKRLFLCLFILIGSIGLGIQLQHEPGYLLLAYGVWTIEMPLWLAFILLIISFSIIYLFLHLISTTSSLGQRFQSWLIRYKKGKAKHRITDGIIQLTEGRWKEAEIGFIKSLISSEIPLMNYFGAAYAANEQCNDEQRNEYLKLARHALPDTIPSIEMMQAYFQYQHRQWDACASTLRHLLQLMPKHRLALALLKEVYIQLQNWTSLNDLLPALKKAKIVNAIEMQILQITFYKENIKKRVNEGNVELLIQYWEDLPSYIKEDNESLKIYVLGLIKLHKEKEAETLLYKKLKKEDNEEFMYLYGKMKGTDPNKQLIFIETKLKEFPHNPLLLFTAGSICLHNQLWGKALQYLEYSLEIKPHIETYLLLGQLLIQLKENEKGEHYFQQGLEMAVNSSHTFQLWQHE